LERFATAEILDDRLLPEEVSLLLDRTSALPIPLGLIDGKTLATIGDAGAYLSRLSAEQLEKHHWKVAIRLLDSALKEPRYLYAANVTLQTALILDGLAGRRRNAGFVAVPPRGRPNSVLKIGSHPPPAKQALGLGKPWNQQALESK
jgi:hypothetical protein